MLGHRMSKGHPMSLIVLPTTIILKSAYFDLANLKSGLQLKT